MINKDIFIIAQFWKKSMNRKAPISNKYAQKNKLENIYILQIIKMHIDIKASE